MEEVGTEEVRLSSKAWPWEPLPELLTEGSLKSRRFGRGANPGKMGKKND